MKNTRADLPTGSKETLRIFVSNLVSRGWKFKSYNFQATLLQGKGIERGIFLVCPK